MISAAEYTSARQPVCFAGVNVVFVLGLKFWVPWRVFQEEPGVGME